MNDSRALDPRYRVLALLGLMACAPPDSAAPRSAGNAEMKPPTAPPMAAAGSAGMSLHTAGANALPTSPPQTSPPPASMAGAAAPPAANGGRAAPPMISAGAPASMPGANMMMPPRAGTMATAPVAGAGGGAGDPMLDTLRQLCVDTINMYRATKMLAPLTRKTDQETCSDNGAKKDGDSMMGHSSAFNCPGSYAQNSCPGYPVGGFGGATLSDTFKTCLMQMWDEGEPPVSRAQCQMDTTGCFEQHGHYLNMTGSFKAVACGFYQMKNGNWWMNQDFF